MIDTLAYYIGLNALFYLLIHIPLDILTLLNEKEKRKTGAKSYPPWEKGKFFTKIITILISIYFWIFFTGWPVAHFFKFDQDFLNYNFEIPFGEAIRYIGLFLIGAGTFIAVMGRIARGRRAISWGVPEKLSTNLGFGIVRHPLYASYCYYFIGIPLAMQNYLLIPMIFGVIGYYSITVYEERILEEEFGDVYREYQRNVGMLIPFIGKKRKR